MIRLSVMVRERDEAMSEDEWFSELPTPSADGGGRRRFLDDGFRTGVKVKGISSYT